MDIPRKKVDGRAFMQHAGRCGLPILMLLSSSAGVVEVIAEGLLGVASRIIPSPSERWMVLDG